MASNCLLRTLIVGIFYLSATEIYAAQAADVTLRESLYKLWESVVTPRNRSPFMKEHSIRQMANELAISQASQQDPWRLVSTSERKISRPQTLDEKTTNRSVLSMTNELKYSSYSGLSGSLRSRHSYTDTDKMIW